MGWRKEGEPEFAHAVKKDGTEWWDQEYRCDVCDSEEITCFKGGEPPKEPSWSCHKCESRQEEERKAWSCYFRAILEAALTGVAELGAVGKFDLIEAMKDGDFFENSASLADMALDKYRERFPWPPKK